MFGWFFVVLSVLFTFFEKGEVLVLGTGSTAWSGVSNSRPCSIGSTAVLMILSKNAGAWNGWWDERRRVNVRRVATNWKEWTEVLTAGS